MQAKTIYEERLESFDSQLNHALQHPPDGLYVQDIHIRHSLGGQYGSIKYIATVIYGDIPLT